MNRHGFLARMLMAPFAAKVATEVVVPEVKVEPIGKVALVVLKRPTQFELRRRFVLSANWERGAFPEGERLDLYSDPWPIQNPVDVHNMRFVGSLIIENEGRTGAHTELVLWDYPEGVRHFYVVPSVPIAFEAHIHLRGHDEVQFVEVP